MAELTKYQKYNIHRVNRSMINESEYNPRVITDENDKALKKILKENGLIEALVWNKRTGNLVSGHQRIRNIDALEKNQEYDLDVCEIDVDENTEVKLNLILNNTSIQGEYDRERMQLLKDSFPGIDFIKDVGFTQNDLDFLELETIEPIANEKSEEENKEAYAKRVDQFEKYKANYDELKKAEIAREKKEGNSISHPERNDKCLTIVFNNNEEKWNFMQGINKGESEKFVKYDDIVEFIREEYRV